MKKLVLSLLIIVSFFLAASTRSPAYAASCGGSLNCAINQCVPSYACGGAGGSPVCDPTTGQPCPGSCAISGTSCTWIPTGPLNCTPFTVGVVQCSDEWISCSGSDGNMQTKQCYQVGGGPTPGPSGGSDCTWCTSASDCAASGGTGSSGAGYCSSSGDVRCCAGSATPGPGGSSDPCPNDTCPGFCCNAECGQPCTVTADCKGKQQGGPTGVQCLWMATGKRCVNPNCPDNSTPAGGGQCGCSGGLVCGQPCAGGCTGGSICTYVSTTGGACNWGSTTYCIGTDTTDVSKTLNPNYIRPICTAVDVGSRYLKKVSNGQTSGFTQTDYDATCSCPIPGDIASTTPTNGGTVTATAGNQVTLSWSLSTGADKYDIELYPQGSDCTDTNAYCSYVSLGGGLSTNSYTFTPAALQYTFRVRGVMSSCGTVSNWTGLINFSILGEVTGTVYSDPNGVAALSGPICSSFGTPLSPIQPGAGSVVTSVDGGGSHPDAPVAANGSYSTVGLFNSSTTITLLPGDTTYACTCPLGCTYGGVLPGETGLNFYASPIGGSWFQVMGGDVNTSSKGGLTFKDPVSIFCTEPTCQPFPLIAPTGLTTTAVGALYSYTGSAIDVSDTTGFQNSPVGPVGGDFPVKTNSSIPCRENYDYFYRIYSLGTTPLEDFVAPQNDPGAAHKPDLTAKNLDASGQPKGAYYRGGDMTISSDWTLAAGESFVIFVNGNLNVTNNAKITVPTTSFLAFLVKGSVTFDPTIGDSDPSVTTGAVQGVYIANGNLLVQSIGATPTVAEKKFVAEGTFVACGDINLPRDYRNSPDIADGVNNNRYPASLFVFRPDVITNTPDKMKRPLMNWKEVAP